jgi:sodium/potassium-transporting ATPase subunit alpha
MGCVVAFIPEGMPIGVSLTLLMVARRMKASNVLPKGLSTVETLGCVNVLCSDKTGTLTQNLMSVASVAFVDEAVSPEDVQEGLKSEKPSKPMTKLHSAAVHCNDACFEPTTMHLPATERQIQGNATDAAVLRFSASLGEADGRKATDPRVFQIPFNSKNKWMLTMFNGTASSDEGAEGHYQVYVKGAPDVLFPACTKFWSAKTGSVQALDSATRSALKARQDQMSRKAERVIMLCEKTMRPSNSPGSNAFSDEVAENALDDLTIIGILGIIDPPRPETASTVAECRRAGIRFFMVTGDYGLTAAAIAHNIGIFTRESVDTVDTMRTHRDKSPSDIEKDRRDGAGRSLLLEGSGVSSLTQEDWDIVCEYEEIVFARTTPEQKLRIVTE